MKKKTFQIIRIMAILLSFVFMIECIYVFYMIHFQEEESLYFDGVNALDSNSSYYVTVGSNNNNVNHYEKAKLSFYNEQKEKTFERLYNVGYNSAFFGVALEKEHIIAVGSYEKTEEDHEKSIRRALIVKYDKEGDIVFESDFSLLENSKFTGVVVVEDGYFVTGQSIYPNTKIGSKEGGAILAKYDKEGKLLWSKHYGSNKAAIFNGLLVIDEFIYTVGTDEGHVGILCKYDLDGNLLQYNDYKYTDDIGFSGIVEMNGFIYISGSNRKIGSVTNAMIVKYDKDCTYIDQVTYENKGTIRYNKLVKDNHNHLIAIGIIVTNKSSSYKTADSLHYDGLIGKYDEDLNEIRVVTYGEDRDDFFTDVRIENGEYLVVGYSSYEDGSYLSKFIRYSDALKVLSVG